MSNGDLNWIANFIWGIADDVLRDLYVRGKYRDVILPMTVLRRLDAVLEPTKQAVLDMKASLDKAGITNQDQALRQAAGQSFYNTSKFTLRDLRARASQQQLKADFEAYLDGYSPNVQEILDNFEFRNQIPRLSKADALGTLIEKFLDPSINLSPNPVLNGDGSQKYPGLDNHGMGTIFEELVRRFNEENNEEAGEHWTPRDAVKLMAKLIFLPIAERIESGTYLLYDGACGTGGMLTVGEETLQQLAKRHGKESLDAPLRSGYQCGNVRNLQSRSAAEGRRRGRGQHHWRTGAFHALQRCVPVARVRFHALESRLTARVGRAIWNVWAARTVSRTRVLSSSTPAIRNTHS
jgi:type I restriction enzyme M protein